MQESSNHSTPTMLTWAVIWLGVATCFIGENFTPATHFLIGNAMRYLIAAIIFALVVYYAKTIYPRISKSEKIVILLVSVISIIAVANSFVLGISPDLLYFSRLIILNISIYLLAKLIPGQDLLKKYLQIIYYIACIASIQGAITLAADVSEFYYIGETVLKGIGGSGDIILPFWGLTGAHAFMRAFWYFSESAYFAQFLMIALGYAIATRRYIGIAVITIGVLASFAVASMIAILIMLIAITIASRSKLALPAATIFATLLVLYTIFGSTYLTRAREGITTRVASIRVISDMKKQLNEIESFNKGSQKLKEKLASHHLNLEQRQELENQIQTLETKITENQSNIRGNLRGKEINMILDLEKSSIPTSQLVPSDNAFYRTSSINNKTGSLETGWQFFLQHPLGGGMIKPMNVIPGLNTAAGWVGLILTFGGLWLLVLLPIYIFLIKNIVFKHYDPLITTMLITFGGILLSTFWHGPHLKYDMLFLLSLLVSAIRQKPSSNSGA